MAEAGGTIVARLVRNAALVTFPKPRQCRFRHLELVALQEFVALMVLVLSEAILKRQLLSFDGTGDARTANNHG